MPAPSSKNKVNDRLNRNIDANNDGVITEQEAKNFNAQANPSDTAKIITRQSDMEMIMGQCVLVMFTNQEM